MPDGQGESIRTYAVSANYQASWWRRGSISAVIGVVLIVVGVGGLAVGSGSAALALVIGVVVGAFGLVINNGVRTTRRRAYSLKVAPDRLVVTWRDQVTELPWADLDHGLVVTNGPMMRTLEVTPRPGVRYVLPRNARPRPSKQRPDNLEVFILSVLGERQAECLADISDHLVVQ